MLTRITYTARRVLVELGRNIFEVFLMLLAASTGVRGLLQPDPLVPSTFEPVLPPWGRAVWFGGLLLGSVVVITGLAVPVIAGSRIEQSGLLILTGSGLSYIMLMLAAGQAPQAAVVVVFLATLAIRFYYLRWEPAAVAAAVRLIRSDADGES